MKRWRLCCLSALLAVAPLAGCEIYFGDHDDDPCEVPVFEDGTGVRNPHNGQCEPGGGGGGGGGHCFGNDHDGGSGGGGGDLGFEAPSGFDWGSCPSFCEQLGEQECLASPECHATYVPGGAGSWTFNECWDLPPSGGNYGQECEGLDAESCNRNADCVSNYQIGDGGGGYPGGGGPLIYDSCAPEGGNHGGCFSQADCPDGTVCTAETECLPPPGCLPGEACPDVCFGHCVPGQNSCAGVECAPGYHCEEVCMSCDPNTGCEPGCEPACVPDGGGMCTLECPPNSVCAIECEPCEDPTDPMCGQCREVCLPVDPPPPPVCEANVCMPGTHCEVHCTMDAAGNEQCQRVCVPDVNSCAEVDCAPGFECIERCMMPPPGCMGGPIGCPPICETECVPVQPATCETQQDAMSCEAVAGCEPVFTANCTPNPDGTFTCSGFTFVHCQPEGAPPALPPMM